ncbi:MAG: succinate dehydrogenase iron-sulfur subunit [Chloroflexi bacterium]|nr:succinate dehydrogenase iron-sulfur subunit [Chloroflexota bacterium]
MQASIRVRRFNPEQPGAQSRFQDFTLEVPPNTTVLDALIKIREEIDGTFAVRCSCRASICGSCAMRVNGQAKLACKTKIMDVARNGGPVVVEPMGNMPVIKDLVTDMKIFWDKVRQVEPYLQPEGPEPQGEYIASNESMNHLVGVMNCIMCGACVSDCTSLAADKNFIAPAALAKAYRFVADPRDGAARRRLGALNEYGGVWDCTRCMYCIEVCPKGVAPMDRIMKMRDLAMRHGYNNTAGARHTASFAKSVKSAGLLNETMLAVESTGLLNIPGQLAQVPIGIKTLMKGKLPNPMGHKIAARKRIRKVFEKVEDGKR